ncbi:hypothetical protein ILUMI_04936, partial [Ignelater luminosus]
KTLEPCHRSDPNLRKCVLDHLNYVLSITNNEVPGFSTSWLNPYKIPILQGNATFENFASASATLKNVELTNAFKVKINDVKTDLENLILELNVTHPKFTIELEYLLDGNILDNPIHSEGFFKGKFINANSNLRLKFKTVEREGVKYYDIVDFKLQMTVEGGSIHLISKDPTEQVLADLLQNMFNQDSHLYLKLLNPVYVERIEKEIYSLFKRILPFIPADNIIID